MWYLYKFSLKSSRFSIQKRFSTAKLRAMMMAWPVSSPEIPAYILILLTQKMDKRTKYKTKTYPREIDSSPVMFSKVEPK